MVGRDKRLRSVDDTSGGFLNRVIPTQSKMNKKQDLPFWSHEFEIAVRAGITIVYCSTRCPILFQDLKKWTQWAIQVATEASSWWAMAGSNVRTWLNRAWLDHLQIRYAIIQRMIRLSFQIWRCFRLQESAQWHRVHIGCSGDIGPLWCDRCTFIHTCADLQLWARIHSLCARIEY